MKSDGSRYFAKLDSRGRVWISKAIRDKMRLPKDSKLVIEMDQNGEAMLRSYQGNTTND